MDIILHCTTLYGHGWEELISIHTCIKKIFNSLFTEIHSRSYVHAELCAHVLYKYTYEGVTKLSASKCNGGSALKGFKEVGLRAGCLLGSNLYGSSMFSRTCEDSSSFKLPAKKHYKLHNSVLSQSLYCTVLYYTAILWLRPV